MQISWNWLSEFVDLSSIKTPQALANLLTNRGLEVEEVRPLAKGFEKVVSVQILEKIKHPQVQIPMCLFKNILREAFTPGQELWMVPDH